MAEVTYTAGYNMMSHLGKGKALLGMYVTSASNSETITTPFMRCVPVLTPAVANAANTILKVSESDGVVTIATGGTNPTGYQALIIGDLY